MSTRATVTRSVRWARKRCSPAHTARTVADQKTAAHRLRRRAWRLWIRFGDDSREPTPRPLTSWEIV